MKISSNVPGYTGKARRRGEATEKVLTARYIAPDERTDEVCPHCGGRAKRERYTVTRDGETFQESLLRCSPTKQAKWPCEPTKEREPMAGVHPSPEIKEMVRVLIGTGPQVAFIRQLCKRTGYSERIAYDYITTRGTTAISQSVFDPAIVQMFAELSEREKQAAVPAKPELVEIRKKPPTRPLEENHCFEFSRQVACKFCGQNSGPIDLTDQVNFVEKHQECEELWRSVVQLSQKIDLGQLERVWEAVNG